MKTISIKIFSDIFKVQVFTVRTLFNDWVQSHMGATCMTHSSLIYSCVISINDLNFFCWVVREKQVNKMNKRRLKKQLLIDKLAE